MHQFCGAASTWPTDSKAKVQFKGPDDNWYDADEGTNTLYQLAGTGMFYMPLGKETTYRVTATTAGASMTVEALEGALSGDAIYTV